MYTIISIVNRRFMETIDSIGSRLRKVRMELGYTQTEFAEIAAKAGVAGATRQSQANYEKGRQMPGAAYLAAIAQVGADVAFILTGNPQGEGLSQLTEAIRITAQIEPNGNGPLSQHLRKAINEIAGIAVAEDHADYVPMTSREKALLENYRASDEAGKKALETTSAALAQARGRPA